MLHRTWMSLSFLTIAIIAAGCGDKPTTSKTAPAQPADSTLGTLAGTAESAPANTTTQDLGTISVMVPAGWNIERPTSTMRKAQYRLPRADGDTNDADLRVFHFGPNQGGSTEENLARWYGQFHQAESSPATVANITVAGMDATVVDVSGTYVARITPMSARRYNEPNYRMLAAIVETPDGNYFFKAVGPEKTIAQWANSFDDYIKSIRFNE